ncbi:MAG: 2-C-methyl-D-erythritol 4-phosphate cytidylyltransferase [Bacteroidota bacterium]
MKTFLVLVAGGSGTRMGTSIPKQFLEINGRPIIYYTLSRFLEAVEQLEIIIVIHPAWKNELNDLLQCYFPEKKFQLADGGETRFHSVKNGLALIHEESLVMIHDAARPFVSTETISRGIAETFRAGSAIPVVSVSESLRKIESTQSRAVNRNDFKLVQTPQCFMSDKIKLAYQIEFKDSFTDDASVFEHAGLTVNLVEGNPENIKITQPSDLDFAEFLLNKKQNN